MSKILHPSNTLYRGEVTNFRDAMVAVRHMCDYESGISWPADDKEDAENFAKLTESLAAMKAAAIGCLREYNAAIAEAERDIFCKFADSANTDVKAFGEAALAGDYSTLAI